MDHDRTRRRFLAGAGVAGAIGLAGCTGSADQGNSSGDDGNESTGGGHEGSHGSLEGPSASATVTMATTDDGSHFEPHVAWVEPGASITWELESGTHTTTAYAAETDNPQRIPEAANSWDSGTLSESGATFEHTFETPGVYDYLCVPHEATGMIGTVIVGSPGTDGQPGLQPPQDALSAAAAEKIESLNQRVTDALDGADKRDRNESAHNDSGHEH
jgi:plastocyanin